MAGRIAGITIEIGGDTSNLQKSLKGVDSQLKTTQANLKDINKLLKLDPANTELLKQKQKELKEAISLTKDRLQQLKDAQSNVAKGTPEWDKLQREIIETEQNLSALKSEYREFGNVAKQQLQAVGDKLQTAGQSVEDFGRKLQPVSAAATALGGALLKLGYDAVTGADDLNTLSKQTGISTEELQKMQYAADLVDVSVEDITGALKKMKPKMDESNETFKNLGVSVTDADGNLRSATDVFYDSVQALSQIENETERDQVAMELFGKSADSLAGIIDDGGAALKEYGEQAREMGIILDQETLDSLNAANDVIDKTKMNIKGTMAVIGAQVVPILQPLLLKGAELISQIGEKLRGLNEEQTETILKVIGIVAAAAPAIMIIGKIITTVGTLVSGLGSLVGLLSNPFVLAIAAAVAAGVLLYKNWDKIKAFAKRLKDSLVKTWDGIKTSISTAVTNLKTSVATAWDNIKTKVQTVGDAIRAKIDAIRTKFNNFRSAVLNLRSSFVQAWSGIKAKIDEVTAPIQAAIEKIKGAFEGFKSIIQPIVDLVQGLLDKLGKLSGVSIPTASGVTKNASSAIGMPTAHVGNAVTINIYSNQSPKEIAAEVERILVNQTIQRGRAYA